MKAQASRLAQLFIRKAKAYVHRYHYLANPLFFLLCACFWGKRYHALRARPTLRHNITAVPDYPFLHNISVAVITGVFGKFERKLKPVLPQTIPADYYVFTNRADLEPREPWVIDARPYHSWSTLLPSFYSPSFVNSWENHDHPHNIAKYYKMQFQRLPQLQKYDVIIWIDSSFAITSCLFIADKLVHLMHSQSLVCAYEHPFNANFAEEAIWSTTDPRWKGTMLRGMRQPFQNVTLQMETYIARGFEPDFFEKKKKGYHHYGLWNCGITAWNMTNPKTREFLDLWFMQNLNFTTQDQISFPYVAWVLKEDPESLPYDVYRNGHVTYAGHGR